MKSQQVNWGGLFAHVVHDLAEGETPSQAVVLCHGYGAPATDLVDLAQPLLTSGTSSGHKSVVIFPAAPLDLAGQGIPGGRAWWPVDLDRLINRRTPELLAEFRRTCPAGLPEARNALIALLGEAGKHYDLRAEQFVLGGFSQGAMITTDVALRLKNRPAGLCALSGALINEEEWQRLAADRGPLRVLQSHGTYDSILPFSLGTALRDLLRSTGSNVEFREFEGDHQIPLEILHRLVWFIAETAKQAS